MLSRDPSRELAGKRRALSRSQHRPGSEARAARDAAEIVLALAFEAETPVKLQISDAFGLERSRVPIRTGVDLCIERRTQQRAADAGTLATGADGHHVQVPVGAVAGRLAVDAV